MNDIDGDTYKAIRLSVTTTGTGNYPVGAAYVLSDLLRMYTTATDDLFAKAH